MKVAIAQLRCIRGDIKQNIDQHLYWIHRSKADAIFFPELSLTSYEPKLAKDLQFAMTDERLHLFQTLSNQKSITIGVGAPLKTTMGIQIAMLIFQPYQPILPYAKQYLHEDERPYFVAGTESLVLPINGIKLAPAICYESLHDAHLKEAVRGNANIYLASVAKSYSGLSKAMKYFPVAARTYDVPILMSNSIGFCDDFQSVGGSAIWNKKGKLIAQLNSDAEGLLQYDTISDHVLILT